ncbi:hypothetical protein J2Y74_001676 [Pseudomonas migulae]|nr:hypothetical protein [Pseudomonas migulae]
MRRLIHRYRRNAARSKPAPTRDWVHTVEIVGAGLPAMDVNDDAGCLNQRGVWAFFAGKPAPTGNPIRFCFSPLIRPSVSSPSAFDLEVYAPSRGRAQVLRSGQPGKDAGLAAPGHGWPMAAGPRSRTGARAWRALARHRTKGARALWLLWGFSKVTRCKSETISSRDRSNGYVHPQKTNRLTRSHRRQASSYKKQIGY